jgi:hypothetical protein
MSELKAVAVKEGMADLGHVGSTLIADPLVKFCSPVCVLLDVGTIPGPQSTISGNPSTSIRMSAAKSSP